MDAALIGSIFAGLAGILGAVFNYLLNRQRRDEDATEELADEVDVLRTRLEVAMRHIHDLRAAMSASGMDLPKLPDDLETRRRRKRGA